MNEVIIGIGSNINAGVHIPKAIQALEELGDVSAVSEILITKPIGITDQEDFSNGAILLSTDLEKADLNKSLKQIEDALGRDRSRPKFGPREIDLDIVVYNNKVVDDDYYTRDFLRALVAQVWAKK